MLFRSEVIEKFAHIVNSAFEYDEVVHYIVQKAHESSLSFRQLTYKKQTNFVSCSLQVV